MLRYLENEMNPKKQRKPIPQDYEGDEEEKTGGGGGISYSYKMQRRGDDERLDTIEGDDEDGINYDEEEKGGNDGNQVEKIEATLDDVEDDDDNESLLGLRG